MPTAPHPIEQLHNHAIITGFGVPGRAAADACEQRDLPYVVIELNRTTVERCARGGKWMIEGDAADDGVLRQAGIDRASLVVVCVPQDDAALRITQQVRKLNPHIRLITRCHYISAGMEAKAVGADEVVIEEQIVASEISRLLRSND